jgi:hypothetical protein
MIYACSAWELAEGTQLLQLQRLQNKDLSTVGNLPNYTPVRELRAVFHLPNVRLYNKIVQATSRSIQHHENELFAA